MRVPHIQLFATIKPPIYGHFGLKNWDTPGASWQRQQQTAKHAYATEQG